MDPAQTTSVPERGGEGFLTHAAEARLRAERDRLAYENEKLRDALVYVVRGHSANDALIVAGLDPFPILTGAPR